jgi:hypothetical protein
VPPVCGEVAVAQGLPASPELLDDPELLELPLEPELPEPPLDPELPEPPLDPELPLEPELPPEVAPPPAPELFEPPLEPEPLPDPESPWPRLDPELPAVPELPPELEELPGPEPPSSPAVEEGLGVPLEPQAQRIAVAEQIARRPSNRGGWPKTPVRAFGRTWGRPCAAGVMPSRSAEGSRLPLEEVRPFTHFASPGRAAPLTDRRPVRRY